MNKYTITDEELKIWTRLETYATLENDKEAVNWLRKLVCREKSWRKLKEAVEEEKNEDLKRIAQNIVDATEKVYDEMLRMFGELEEAENASRGNSKLYY